MKVTFLGTSDGIPRPGHFCTSTMIEENGAIYLIDVGAPVPDLLFARGKRLENIKAIFNTHGHGDHLDGMLQLLDLSHWAYKTASYDIFLPEKKIGEGFINCLESMSPNPVDRARLRMHEFSAGEVYADENIKVTAFATKHCQPRPSYAFLVENAQEKKILFTGDMSVVNGDFPQIAYELPTELIVCELAHFCAEHITPCLEKCLTKQVAFNHYQQRKERDIEHISQCAHLPFPIHQAKDGDEIVIY